MPGKPKRPVLLVHGILGQRHLYWNLFRHRLESDGFEVEEVTLPRWLFGDIRKAAEVLRDDVEAMCRDGGKVDLVCHSAGGLVARHYIQTMEGRRRVRNLVLLGTPHQGTLFAYAVGVPVPGLATQARPDSQVLRDLNAKAWPKSVRVTNFWSPIDGIVIPGDHSRWPGATNVKVWTHHWGYLVGQGIYTRVRDALLADGPKRRPGADAGESTGADEA